MYGLKEQQIIQNYKGIIIKIFSVSDARAILLATELFEIIEAKGGHPCDCCMEDMETSVRIIVGDWIENKVFLKCEDK